jgi:hypothetical protein
MSTLEQLVEIAKRLPAEDQQKLLEQAERMRHRGWQKPRHNVKGALAHLGVRLDEDDVREMRREAWKNFPREIES